MSKKKHLSLRVLKKFRVIYGSVRQHFRDVEQTCGVSGSQLWVMQEVANTHGIGVSELAERLSIHQSTCSQLVEKLVARKLILKERSKEDQRRVGLYITDTAAKLLKDAPGPSEGVLPEALGALSIDLGFNRWMQHTRNCVSRRSVANETETTYLLYRNPESIDVGTLEERRLSPADCTVV